jgi:hypothetical protein
MRFNSMMYVCTSSQHPNSLRPFPIKVKTDRSKAVISASISDTSINPSPPFLLPFSLPKIIYTYKNENRSHRDQTKKKKTKTRQAPPTQRRRKPVCDRCSKKRMYNSKAKRKKKAREESNFGFQRSPTPKKKEKKKTSVPL